MGGLNPGSGDALLKKAMRGEGTAWCRGVAVGKRFCSASATDEQTMQDAQVGQVSSAALLTWALESPGAGGNSASCAQSGCGAGAAVACVGRLAGAWCAALPCCCAMEIAMTSAAKPRKGVNRIIRMTSQWRMQG